jgi:hypothetical protein
MLHGRQPVEDLDQSKRTPTGVVNGIYLPSSTGFGALGAALSSVFLDDAPGTFSSRLRG